MLILPYFILLNYLKFHRLTAIKSKDGNEIIFVKFIILPINNRNYLENKRISFEIKTSNEVNKSYYLNRKKSINWIYSELNKYYENWQNSKLIIGGDGANWISKIADNLGATKVLCKFHIIQHSRNSFLIINNNNYHYVDYKSYKIFWKAINTFNLNLALETLMRCFC